MLQPTGPAATCTSDSPLLYSNLKVTRLAKPATDSYDFSKGCGTGVSFSLTVNGAHPSSPYSVNPYTAAGTAAACP